MNIIIVIIMCKAGVTGQFCSIDSEVCKWVIMDPAAETRPLPLSLFPPSFTLTSPHTHTTHTHFCYLSLALSLFVCLSFYLSVSNNGAQQSKEDPVCRTSTSGTSGPPSRRTCECV